LFMANGKGFDASDELIAILNKKGFSILKLDFKSASLSASPNQQGIVHYFENNCSNLPIQKENDHDTLLLGENFIHAYEIIGSRKFNQLLSQLKGRYDWVIAVTDAPLESVGVEVLIPVFDFTAINVSGESINDIYPLTVALKKEGKENFASFLITRKN
jgi:hypothetical protein